MQAHACQPIYCTASQLNIHQQHYLYTTCFVWCDSIASRHSAGRSAWGWQHAYERLRNAPGVFRVSVCEKETCWQELIGLKLKIKKSPVLFIGQWKLVVIPFVIPLLYHPPKSVLYHPRKSLLYHPRKSVLYHPQKSMLYHPQKTVLFHPRENQRIWRQLYKIVLFHPWEIVVIPPLRILVIPPSQISVIPPSRIRVIPPCYSPCHSHVIPPQARNQLFFMQNHILGAIFHKR